MPINWHSLTLLKAIYRRSFLWEKHVFPLFLSCSNITPPFEAWQYGRLW